MLFTKCQPFCSGLNVFVEHLVLGALFSRWQVYPDSKVHGANMGPIWGRQDPDGPHVGPINFAIWLMHVLNIQSSLVVPLCEKRCFT